MNEIKKQKNKTKKVINICIIIIALCFAVRLLKYSVIEQDCSDPLLELLAISFQVTFITTTLLGGLSDKSEKLYWIVYPDEYLIHGCPGFTVLSTFSYVSLAVESIIYFFIEDELLRGPLFIVAFTVGTMAIVWLCELFSSVYFSRDALLEKHESVFTELVEEIKTLEQKYDFNNSANDIKKCDEHNKEGADIANEENENNNEWQVKKGELEERCIKLYNFTMEAVLQEKRDTRRIVENICLLLKNHEHVICDKWLKRIVYAITEKDDTLMGQCTYLIEAELKKGKNIEEKKRKDLQDALYGAILNETAGMWTYLSENISKWFEDSISGIEVNVKEEPRFYTNKKEEKKFIKLSEQYLSLFNRAEDYYNCLLIVLSKMHVIEKEQCDHNLCSYDSPMLISYEKEYLGKLFDIFIHAVKENRMDEASICIGRILNEIDKGVYLDYLEYSITKDDAHIRKESTKICEYLKGKLIESIGCLYKKHKSELSFYRFALRLEEEDIKRLSLYLVDMYYQKNSQNWPGNKQDGNIGDLKRVFAEKTLKSMSEHVVELYKDENDAISEIKLKDSPKQSELDEFQRTLLKYNDYVCRYSIWFAEIEDEWSFMKFVGDVFKHSLYDSEYNKWCENEYLNRYLMLYGKLHETNAGLEYFKKALRFEKSSGLLENMYNEGPDYCGCLRKEAINFVESVLEYLDNNKKCKDMIPIAVSLITDPKIGIINEVLGKECLEKIKDKYSAIFEEEVKKRIDEIGEYMNDISKNIDYPYSISKNDFQMMEENFHKFLVNYGFSDEWIHKKEEEWKSFDEIMI